MRNGTLEGRAHAPNHNHRSSPEMTPTTAALLTACLAAQVGAQAVTCTGSTATTITVSWEAVDATDLYYIALSTDATSRPFALKTTDGPATSLTLTDLLPGTDYFLTLRSHPSAENVVWGWRPAEEVGRLCATAAASSDVPHALRRVGSTPSERSISLQWNHSMASNATAGAHSAGIRRVVAASAPEQQWRWEAASGADELSHTFNDLTPGCEWELAVREDATGAVSQDVERMRTAAAGALHTAAWRIAEFTWDPDFLTNHDAATQEAIALYVQNGGAKNESDLPWVPPAGADPSHQYSVDGCLGALAKLCPGLKAMAFACMKCSDDNRAAVEKECGVFPDGDSSHLGGWAQHFYCGVGWPESTFQRSPISEYCVEHLPAPQTDPIPGGDGFAQYVSCNSDECDGALLPTGNSPRDPKCICWVWDDRLISQVPASAMSRDCSTDVKIPWTNANQCNCSTGPGTAAAMLTPGSPMATYVGRSKVYLPYYYYDKPQQSYNLSVPAGDNLSFPKGGLCNATMALGEGGCTWKILPSSRMLYGADLLAAGWDTSPVPNRGDVKEELAHTYRNVAVFNRAVDTTDKFISPRCCGC